jgi:hypothetical protein
MTSWNRGFFFPKIQIMDWRRVYDSVLEPCVKFLNGKIHSPRRGQHDVCLQLIQNSIHRLNGIWLEFLMITGFCWMQYAIKIQKNQNILESYLEISYVAPVFFPMLSIAQERLAR